MQSSLELDFALFFDLPASSIYSRGIQTKHVQSRVEDLQNSIDQVHDID